MVNGRAFLSGFIDWRLCLCPLVVAHAKNRRRLVLHLVLLGLVLIQLIVLSRLWPSSITPDASWEPHGLVNPIWDIFKLLIISVGPAYFLLSANSPLMQVWFNRALPGRSPYSLYALSNLGSLLGLVTYPIFVGASLDCPRAGDGLVSRLRAFRIVGNFRNRPYPGNETGCFSTIRYCGTRRAAAEYRRCLVMACAGCLRLNLVPCDHHSYHSGCGGHPVLVDPAPYHLFAYLHLRLFFREMVFAPDLFGIVLRGQYCLCAHPLCWPDDFPADELTIYSVVLFIACMICHGELYRLRPDPARLTTFYLMVSIGGALGGIFVNFVAPSLFTDFWELPIAMLFCWVLLLIVMSLRAQPRRSGWVNILKSWAGDERHHLVWFLHCPLHFRKILGFPVRRPEFLWRCAGEGAGFLNPASKPILAGLRVLDRRRDVRGHRANLGVRHQAARAEDLAEATDHAHRVRARDHDVEVHLAGLDLLGKVFHADDVGAGGARHVLVLAAGEHGNDELLCRSFGITVSRAPAGGTCWRRCRG